jgi:hypothetical protein
VGARRGQFRCRSLGPARLTKLGERRARSTPCSPSDRSGLVTGRCHSDRRRTGYSPYRAAGSHGRGAAGPWPARGGRGSAVLAACGRPAAGRVAGGRAGAAGRLGRAALGLAIDDTSRLIPEVEADFRAVGSTT